MRPTLCGLLITSRYVITYALSVYLFWSFVFRMLLVLYADRGLVVPGGGTNLKLFHHLFWLIFTTLVVQVIPNLIRRICPPMQSYFVVRRPD